MAYVKQKSFNFKSLLAELIHFHLFSSNVRLNDAMLDY